jgi:hypothetical protein
MTGAWVYCELPNMIASPSLSSDLRIKSALESLTDTRGLKELF